MSDFKKLLGWIFPKGGSDTGLLILRVCAGAFMLTHGLPKLLYYGDLSQTFGDPVGLGSQLSLTLIVFAEFFCSILLILGAFTRLAAIPLIIGMIVAAFFAHQPFAFDTSEKALLYLIVFVSLLFMGGGRFSIDGLIRAQIFEKQSDKP